MEHDLFLTVPEEVRGHDDRQVATGAGGDELPEVVFLEEGAPFRVVERRIVTVDQHAVIPC